MNLNDWFNEGISKEAYMSDLDKHRDHFHTVYDNFEVPEEDKAILKSKSNFRVIVLAEVWCGFCMMEIPVLLKILEAAHIPVSFLPRDDHLELMDQYTTDGKRIIPIFIFIDEDGNELGKWGPMAPEVKEFSNQLKKNLPSKDNPDYKEAFRKYAEKVTESFTKDDTHWVPTYHSIVKALP